MSNAAKHRRKAAEFEQLKQIDRAIASYVRAVEESEAEAEEVDVALLNKVGDLALRQGRVADAVTYYERAVEHYATSGLFNNAIALCNKILRNAPGRSNVYFTLGRICARKKLRGDATRNFLEYATRMQQEGRVDEGMRALAEVADLLPELVEIRRLVDEHAARAGIAMRRRTPARSSGASADRADASERSPDLVFLDVDYEQASASWTNTPRPSVLQNFRTPVRGPAAPVVRAASAPPPPAPVRDLGIRRVTPADSPAASTSAALREPFRLDPHDFEAQGELPPLLFGDLLVRLGLSLPVTSSRASTPLRTVSLTPSLPIAAVAVEANSVATLRRDELRSQVTQMPWDWVLRRRLAEALFEAGERTEALAELELALTGLAKDGDVASAADIADMLVTVNPERVPYHQKRVALAVRLADGVRLRSAYLDLADSLVRTGEETRARALYERVLEMHPTDDRARTALGVSTDRDAKNAQSFTNLAEWLRDDHAPVSSRMRMPEPTVSGDEQADFDQLLQHFKAGVARSIGDDDFESRYDLGVAYKEMGLLDDAIGEFQRALRSPAHRLRAYEALGQCFVEQERFELAATILTRAVLEPGFSDEQRVGILYLLALSCQAKERFDDARGYFQRVYATDIRFRDVAARLAALELMAL